MCSVSRNRLCCLIVMAMCCMCVKRAFAQRAQSYILDTAEVADSFEPYRISFSASSRAVTVSFPVGGSQAINLRAEYFRTSSLPKVYEKVFDLKADWKFKSVPITASYTYAFPGFSSRFVPVAGLGVSAHFYRETRRFDAVTGLPVYLSRSPRPSKVDKLGLKVGAEASFGIRTQISRRVFVMTEGRYRYVNCSVEALNPYRGPALNVFDFNVDIGFTF